MTARYQALVDGGDELCTAQAAERFATQPFEVVRVGRATQQCAISASNVQGKHR